MARKSNAREAGVKATPVNPTTEALEACLVDLNEIAALGPYLGVGERSRAEALRRRVHGRINAEDGAKLALEAREFVQQYLPQLKRMQARVQERQADAEAHAAEQLAARKAREAEVAEKLREAEQRRIAATAVSEVI